MAVLVQAGDAEAAGDCAGAWLTLVLSLAEGAAVRGPAAEGDLLTDGLPDDDAEAGEDPAGDIDAGEDPSGDAGAGEDPAGDTDGDGDPVGDTDGDGDGDTEGDEDTDGDGEGDALACAGSAWHDEVVAGVVTREAACAVPVRPTVRKLPLSNVTAATRMCPKCISITCLRRRSGFLLGRRIRVSSHSGADGRWMGQACRGLAHRESDGPAPPIGSVAFSAMLRKVMPQM